MNKEDLFKKLRANTREQYDMPDMHIDGIQYPDTFKQFVKMTEKVGGNVVEVKREEADDLDAVIKKQYPEAKTFASNLPYIHIAQKKIGVAENGCVWIPQTMKEKAVCFISEYLVIVLDRNNIVNNMHEAYKRIEFNPKYQFGTFISGPSKTADIEQALVMGAQAAQGVTVIIVE